MKHVLLFIICLSFIGSGLSQNWMNVAIPFSNDDVLDVKLHNGRMYVLDKIPTPNTLRLHIFNPSTGTWQVKATNSDYITKAEIHFYQDSVYVLGGYDGMNLKLYNANMSTGNLSAVSPDLPNYGNGNAWRAEFISPSEIYIIRRINYSDMQTAYYDGTIWHTQSVLSQFDSFSGYAQIANMNLGVDQNSVYIGYGETTHQLFKFARQSSSMTLSTYDGSANGYIQLNGSNWHPAGSVMLSDQLHTPILSVVNNTTTNPGFTNMYGPVDQTLNFTPASPTQTKNFNPFIFDTESKGTEAYIGGQYQNQGSDVFNQTGREVRVYKKDLSNGSSTFVPVGGVIQQIDSLKHKFILGVDRLSNHISVYYANSSNVALMKVTNEIPSITNDLANTGLCTGSGLLYPNIQITDLDGDLVRIISATPLNNSIDPSCLQIVPQGRVGNVSSFKIYGCLFNSNTDALVITYTDGFSVYTDTLEFLNGNATPAPVTFNTSDLKICTNEDIATLSVTPSIPGGIFRYNGNEINVEQIDVQEFVNAGVTSGIIDYEVYNAGGCKRSGNFNFTMVEAPSIQVTTNPSACNTNSGSAAVVLTPGTSTSLSWEWSTGATTTILSNLNSGPYYCQVVDANNCKATALANVHIQGIDLSGSTMVHPTCTNSDDGQITLDVQGTSDYGILWSTGHSGPSISNLSAGVYEATLYDHASGCTATKFFVLENPDPIQATLTIYEPDCGMSNGVIYGTFAGGTGTLSYNWENGLATTQNLTNIPFGLYSVEVTDQNGCTATFHRQLDEWQALAIFDTVVKAECNMENGAIFTYLFTQNGGAALNTINWSNGDNTPFITNLETGIYHVLATTTTGCKSGKRIVVPTKAPLYNPICLVTVDEGTNTNEVVWEKVESDGISHYKIFREKAVAGTYMLIDTVNYASNSVFNDVVADAETRSWRYKIAAVNECGVTGPLSLPHKTMHMTAIEELANGTVDIFWDDYEGLDGVEYIVRRYSDENGWENLSPSVPTSVSVFTDTPPTNLTNLDYVVEMSITGGCDPNPNKAEDYNYIRSNREKGQFQPGIGTGESSNSVNELNFNGNAVLVYPNPFSDEITISMEKLTEMTFEIRNISGSLVEEGMITSQVKHVTLTNLNPGIYFVLLRKDGETKTIKLEKL